MEQTTRKCSKCGGNMVRGQGAGAKFRCRPCFQVYKKARLARVRAESAERECSECGTGFRSLYPQAVTCSAECGRDRERRRSGQTKLSAAPLTCPVCKSQFTPHNSTHKFCSKGCTMVAHGKWSGRPRVVLTDDERAALRAAANKRWAEKNPDRIRHRASVEVSRAAVLRRRARIRGVASLPFTPRDLAAKFAYWGGRCWMCSADATSVDHVKPIIANGPHMLSNLRPACGSCNSSKGGRWFGVSELHRFMK